MLGKLIKLNDLIFRAGLRDVQGITLKKIIPFLERGEVAIVINVAQDKNGLLCEFFVLTSNGDMGWIFDRDVVEIE